MPTNSRLQPGLSTYSFPWAIGMNDFAPAVPLTATGLLKFAAARDIRYVQFGDNMPLHFFSEQQLNDLRETADSLQVRIQAGTRGLRLDNITIYLSIAQKLNSSFLRVVIDDGDYQPGEQQVIETIRKLLPQLKDKGITLAIENHDRYPSVTLKNIIEETDPASVGICLDTANSLGANEGINEVLQVLGAYTINLHVKDITINRLAHKMGFTVEGCAAGNGILDIPGIIKQLQHYGKCETATLELWSQPETTIEQTIAREKEWVESSINYLKTLLT